MKVQEFGRRSIVISSISCLKNETQLLVGNAIISFTRTIISNLVLYEKCKVFFRIFR